MCGLEVVRGATAAWSRLAQGGRLGDQHQCSVSLSAEDQSNNNNGMGDGDGDGVFLLVTQLGIVGA